MSLASEKSEIIKWIHTLENQVVLDELKKIRNKNAFDFEKEWKEGITISEARKKTSDFIKSLDWKK